MSHARIEDGTQATALTWLERARSELAVLEPILTTGQWRVAYNAAYDIYRHAAYAVDLAAGYRILTSPGAHRATFELASAVVGDASDVFDDDARWAVQLAGRAVADASSFVS